jgi:hypothetical protein
LPISEAFCLLRTFPLLLGHFAPLSILYRKFMLNYCTLTTNHFFIYSFFIVALWPLWPFHYSVSLLFNFGQNVCGNNLEIQYSVVKEILNIRFFRDVDFLQELNLLCAMYYFHTSEIKWSHWILCIICPKLAYLCVLFP